MILITGIICFILIFLSGMHWGAFKIDTEEEHPRAYRHALWSVACGLIGLYHLIAIVGLASA